MPPWEARQDRTGQAGRIDFDDLIGTEELVEAAAEMAARFYHHDPCGTDVQAERLKEHWIGALISMRQDDHGDAVQLQRGRFADVQRIVRVDAATPLDRPVEQRRDHCWGSERLGEFVAAVAVEPRLEDRASAQRMSLGCESGIMEDAD